jgi:hypothetical protein
LEVVRHVNLGQDLIRPTTERLTGQRAIASYFKSNPDKAQLAKATQRLMQSDLGDETRSFNVEGGDWTANSMFPPRLDPLDSFHPPPEPPTIETEVSTLKAQVVVLTAVQEGLLTRLARLESRLAEGAFVPAEPRAGAAAARGGKGGRGAARPTPEAASVGSSVGEAESVPSAPPSAPPSSDAASPGQSASAPPSAQAPASEAAASAAAAPEAAAPAPAAPAERVLLELPSMGDLIKCVVLLIGGDVTAKPADPLPVNRTSRDCFAAAILDDRDQTVGMILMDLKATVCLGGTLMMLPKMELEQQLKTMSPGEDSIAASAEICNALTGAINGAQDQHVRAGPLEKFEFKSWSWVSQAEDRRDLEDSFGGRTVVFSRPLPVSIG